MKPIHRHIDYMLMAKELAEGSKCDRRKIGTVVPLPVVGEVSVGINGFSNIVCNSCTRMVECPALHSEVQAILNSRPYSMMCKYLYIWAEVPCLNCLSFISHQSGVHTIFCLCPTFYSKYYGNVKDYSERIVLRRAYAKRLSIKIVELTEEDFPKSIARK